ncbi:MAG: hypothetical protein RLZZ67_620 [Candidatus Parcubacteria bacterium]|jgi:hypothetical protein
MKDDLQFEGKNYFSSKRAAKNCGYTQDYIGQLIRSKKVEARMVGRVWFVSEESILAYKTIADNYQGGKSAFPKSSTVAPEAGQIKSQFNYFADNRPSLPELNKAVAPVAEPTSIATGAEPVEVEIPARIISSFETPALLSGIKHKLLAVAFSLSLVTGSFWMSDAQHAKAALNTLQGASEYAGAVLADSYDTFSSAAEKIANSYKALANNVSGFFKSSSGSNLAATGALGDNSSATTSTQSTSSPVAQSAVANNQSQENVSVTSGVQVSVPTITSAQVDARIASVQKTIDAQIAAIKATSTITIQNIRNTRDANLTKNINASSIEESTIKNSTLNNSTITSARGLSVVGDTSLAGATFVTATGTSATTTNFYTDNLTASNITFTSSSVVNATTTNSTTTNMYADVANLGAATSTSFFASIFHAVSGVIDTLTATLATITDLFTTNLVATNATTTNATSTNVFANTASVGSLTASGNVGVGTTSPYAKLSVSSFNGGSLPLFAIGTSTGAGATSTSFIVDAYGSVGINTAFPNPLDFGGGTLSFKGRNNSTTGTFSAIGNNVIGSNPIGRLAFIQEASGVNTNVAFIQANRANSSDTSADLTFMTSNAGSLSEKMRILYNGNVGIGSTSPSVLLTIASSTPNSTHLEAIRISNSNSSAWGSYMFFERPGNPNRGLSIGEQYAPLSGLIPFIRTAGAVSEELHIGTGVDDSGVKGNIYLDSKNLSATTGKFGVATTTGWASLSVAGLSGQTNPLFAVSSSTSAFATSTAFIIDSNGKTGIGTTSPLAKLDVVDSAQIIAAFRGTNAHNTVALDNLGGTSFKSQLSFQTQGTEKWAIGNDINATGADNFYIWNGVGGRTPFAIDGTANTIVLSQSGSYKVGVASTTPWGQFSINPNGITGPAFAIGSSTKTNFLVTNNGQVGINTTAPLDYLSIVPNDNIDYTDVASGIAQKARGITISSYAAGSYGDLRIGNYNDGTDYASYIRLGGGSGESLMLSPGRTTTGDAGQILIGADRPNSIVQIGGFMNTAIINGFSSTTVRLIVNNAQSTANLFNVMNSGNIGIGSTSPWAQLSVNPNGISGPSFVIGSSTRTDFMVTNGGNVGIKTTAPIASLDISPSTPITATYTAQSVLRAAGILDGSAGDGTARAGANLIFDTQGSASNLIIGQVLSLNAGYTGSGRTWGLSVANTVAGTNPFTAGTQSGNVGIFSQMTGAGVDNIGVYSQTSGGSGLNLGYYSRLTGSTGTKAVGYLANVTSGSSVNIGGYFALYGAGTSQIDTSAALIADSDTTSNAIFLGRVNGVTKYIIDGNGNVGIGTSTPFGNGLLTVGTSSPNFYVDRLSGNIGIGTVSPTRSLDSTGMIQGWGGLSSGNVVEKSWNVDFAGVPNEKVDIFFPASNRIVGSFDITIAGGFYTIYSAGGYTKEFGVLGQNNGSLTLMKAQVTRDLGETSNFFSVGDFRWDATALRWRVTVSKLSGGAQTISIHYKAYPGDGYFERMKNADITSIYTTDTTVFPSEGLSLNGRGNLILQPTSGNVGIGSTTPMSLLSVYSTTANADVRASAVGSGISSRFILESVTPTSGTSDLLFRRGQAASTIQDRWRVSSQGSENSTDNGAGSDFYIQGQVNNGGWTDRLFINRLNGNVGIGTTAPGSLLHITSGSGVNINSLIQFQRGSNQYGFIGQVYAGNVANDAATDDMVLRSNTNLILTAGGAPTVMYIKSTGNVGIGTTSPYAKLSVAGEIVGQNFVATSTSATSTFQGTILAGSGGNVVIGGSSSTYKLDTNGTLAIGNTTDTSTQDEIMRLRIGSSGAATGYIGFARVSGSSAAYKFGFNGIGSFGIRNSADSVDTFNITNTTSADATKAISFGSINGVLSQTSTFYNSVNNTETIPLRVSNSQTGALSNSAIGFASINNSGNEYNYAKIIGIKKTSFTAADPTGELAFSVTNGSATFNEAMRISSSGNVGIGTASPNNKLEVSTTSGSADFKLLRVASSNQYMELGIDSSSDYSGAIWVGGVKSARFNANGGASIGSGAVPPASGLLVTGNVGIGTTSPASLFTVVGGGACFSGSGATVACGNAAGNLYYRTANTGTYDVAENYVTSDLSVVAGDIVALDTTASSTITKAVFGSRVIGIVSTDPGLLLGGADGNNNGSSTRPVALSGRVPVKVNGENGNIVIGDKIALSTVAGVGRKAKGSEEVVGTALENWSGGVSDTGTVTVFVSTKQHFDDDKFSIDQNGNIGIGTTTPTYKLQVMGDIAATSFVNISTRDAKHDIRYLDGAERTSILNRIKTIGIAQYRYNTESDTAPLRLGLIAEEAPVEVLAIGGKGVDVYKLSTFILAGVQEMQASIEKMNLSVEDLKTRMTSVEGRLASLENFAETGGLAAVSASSTASTTMSTVSSYLASAGIAIDAVASKIMAIVTDTLTANFVVINKTLTVQTVHAESISSSELRVGTSTKSSEAGITIIDRATGQPYCMFVSNGLMQGQPGECATPVIPPVVPVESGSGSGTGGGTTGGDTGTTTSGSGDTGTTTPDGSGSTGGGEVVPEPSPTPEPILEPVPEVVPEPTPTPEPVPEPTPEASAETPAP